VGGAWVEGCRGVHLGLRFALGFDVVCRVGGVWEVLGA
jgi:hypothetical protein